jgi:hypothetical protein
MTIPKLNPREQTLIFLLLLTAMVTFYLAFPFRKQVRALGHLLDRAELASAELEGLEASRPARPLKTDQLEQKLSGLKREEALLRNRIDELGGGPFIQNDPERIENLNLRISSLAGLCGADVIENIPLRAHEANAFMRRHKLGTAGDTAGRPGPLPGDPGAWSFRKLTLQASFSDFRTFIEGFCRLSPRIWIVGFEMGNEQKPLSFGLRIQLTWVIV